MQSLALCVKGNHRSVSPSRSDALKARAEGQIVFHVFPLNSDRREWAARQRFDCGEKTYHHRR